MRRELTNSEVSLLSRLLESDFPGRDEIAKQVHSARVEPIDANGSLNFFVCNPTRVETKFRIPVEGEFEDVDGVTIHVLLHVVNGIVDELEVYKEDGSNVQCIPEATQLRIFTPQGKSENL